MGLPAFDRTNAKRFLSDDEVARLGPYAALAGEQVHARTGPGADYLGWAGLPQGYDRAEFARANECAKRIREDSQILVVVGIGGSYLGARAVIDALSHSFAAQIGKVRRQAPLVVYAGNSLSSTYLADLLELLEGADFSLNVVSKSGTTTEPAVAFRSLKELAEKRYGKAGAARRIYATTDRARGALKTLADAEGYETFVIPDDVGGRFSVLTAVGLLPIAAAGIDIGALLAGAQEAQEAYLEPSLEKNPCHEYAAARNALHRKGLAIEVLANYEPSLHYVGEWWKQLFGESEGKEGKGIFPAAVDLTTDLHSMGQYIQDGLRTLFETALLVESPRRNLAVREAPGDIDGLNYLAGKDIDYINKMAAQGTAEAHVAGGVPNLAIRIPELDAHSMGGLLYFFEKACAVSGYLLGVNPFDQPGVEAYKKCMFRLLGKPGH